jgi:hypothetical protein
MQTDADLRFAARRYRDAAQFVALQVPHDLALELADAQFRRGGARTVGNLDNHRFCAGEISG